MPALPPPRRLILLGPPGSGKGTQARWLGKELRIPHISTGLIFREAMQLGTELGRVAKSFTDGGNLVPDEIVFGIAAERLGRADCAERGFLLDGFPRTIPQADALGAWLAERTLKLDAVIELEVPEAHLVERLSGRILCTGCGKDYNSIFRHPRTEGLCDYCGQPLARRADDEPEAVRNRLKVDAAKTRPLHDYYEKKGLLAVIPGVGSIEEIFRRILAFLGHEAAAD